jgi:hypothetical protein
MHTPQEERNTTECEAWNCAAILHGYKTRCNQHRHRGDEPPSRPPEHTQDIIDAIVTRANDGELIRGPRTVAEITRRVNANRRGSKSESVVEGTLLNMERYGWVSCIEAPGASTRAWTYTGPDTNEFVRGDGQ